MNRITTFLLFITLSIFAFSQDGALDQTFNSFDMGAYGNGRSFNNWVWTSAIQPDGKIIVAGVFSNFNGYEPQRIARLNPDGTFDTSFKRLDINGDIRCISIQKDGAIIIGGNFTRISINEANRLARLLPNGTLDLSFNIGSRGFNDVVMHTEIQDDGKIIVNGNFTKLNNDTANYVVRLNSDGSRDGTFNIGQGFNDRVWCSTIQPNGKILLGGFFTKYNNQQCNRIARLNIDGSLDESFDIGLGFDSVVLSIALQQDGGILVGGDFEFFDSIPASKLVRLNEDGNRDESFEFTSKLNSWIYDIGIQADEKIVIVGHFTEYSNTTANRIIRIEKDGTIDLSFDVGSGASNHISSVAIQEDKKIILTGFFQYFNEYEKNRIVRLETSGNIDESFNPQTGFNNGALSMALADDEGILVGGRFTSFNNKLARRIVKILPDGDIDTTFDSKIGFDNVVRILAVQNDGKIIVGGDFTKYNEKECNGIIRLNKNGSIDESFNIGSGFNGSVMSIAIQNDGKIIVGGDFTQYRSVASNRLIRLNSDGSKDPSFNVGQGFDKKVWIIKILPNNKILVGGDFEIYQNVSKRHLLRINSNGSLDQDFKINFGFNGTVRTIEILKNGHIAVGGDFTLLNGNAAEKIIKLNANGEVDETFNANFGRVGAVNIILEQSNGKIWAGGEFNSIDGQMHRNIVRFNNDGTIDGDFESGFGFEGSVNAFLPQNNNMIVGGFFTSYNNFGKNNLVRLLNNEQILSTEKVVITDSKLQTKVYPNPNQGQFQIEFDEVLSNVQITCLDIFGKEIFNNTYSNTHLLQLNISSSPGVYFIHITSEKWLEIVKVVKK